MVTENISDVIHQRRSTKTASMNGKKIPDELLLRVLEHADWAPTHGRTEPWRFVIFSDDKVAEFGKEHAQLYQIHTPEDKFLPTTYDKLLHNGDLCSHVVVAVMQRGHLPKIPPLEEIAATAAAIQNVLLAATAEGIATFWSTGGMVFHPSFRAWLGFGENDQVMGVLYFGYSHTTPEAKRNIPFSSKLKWVK